MDNSISIRKVQQSDLKHLFDLLTQVDSPFWPRLNSDFEQFASDFHQSHFDSDNFKRFVVIRENQIIGLVNIFKTAPYSTSLELGYITFKQNNRQKGYMFSALKQVVRYLFSQENIVRVQVGITTGNQASLNLAQKLGFVSEGVLRQFFQIDGEYKDVEILAMIKEPQ